MHLSVHYYVLSLSSRTNTLFEAFRDSLITIENEGFPFVALPRAHTSADVDPLLALVHAVDERFAHYAELDPLCVVVVGENAMVSAFLSVTRHGDAFIGRVDGNHENTSPHDLGQIVWPIVKEAMSGVLDRTMGDLEALTERGRVVSGLESVARAARHAGRATTLLVEDDFHMRGRIDSSRETPVIFADVDVTTAIDDVVDSVIEIVLQSGGNIVFGPGGSLKEHGRIVLLMRGDEHGSSGPTP